jgi:hypothetical protein
VRKVKTEGPQRITVHGREEVIVVSVEEYRRAKRQPTGQALTDVLQDAPFDDVHFDRLKTVVSAATRSRSRISSSPRQRSIMG